VRAPKSFVLKLAALERVASSSSGRLSDAQTAEKGRKIVTSVRDVEANAGMLVYGWMIVRMAVDNVY